MSDADEMRELLAYAAFHKVAAALNVSRTAVSYWAKGRDVTPYRVRQVRDLLRPPTPQEAAPPEWVKRLLAGVMALEEEASVSDAALARAQARAAIYLAAGTQTRRRPGAAAAGGGSTS